MLNVQFRWEIFHAVDVFSADIYVARSSMTWVIRYCMGGLSYLHVGRWSKGCQCPDGFVEGSKVWLQAETFSLTLIIWS